MKTEPVVVDAREDEEWLEKAVRLFEQGQLHKITGNRAQIEEFLRCTEERQPKKAPPEIIFSLELAPKDLAPA